MRALDLFCGMGGASLGLEMAGLDVTGVEFDPVACDMHRHVCSGDVIQADIAAIQPDGFLRPGLLWASPPCQPFSQAGLRKGMADHRAHLIFEVPRYVKALLPRFVICEQVKAALPWWEQFALEFQEWGYSTWTGLLHSEEYGVPQTRTRAFLLASLDGTATPPPATHRRYHTHAPHDRPTDGRLPYVTMADVINIEHDDLVGFARKDDGAEAINGYRRRDFREGDDPAFTMTSKGRSWSVNTGRGWKPGGDRSTAQQRDADCPAPTVTGDSSLNKWMLAGRQSRLTMRMDGEPAPTVTAGHDVSQWKLGARLLTVQDGLALQTFPTDCLDGMEVTKTAAFKAIGNAVPPLWVMKIAQHLTGATNG
jgi:DNA (cytosine-5)-methyltransferase 1